jgi:hypothetical protein
MEAVTSDAISSGLRGGRSKESIKTALDYLSHILLGVLLAEFVVHSLPDYFV